MKIEDILKAAYDDRASDIHIVTNGPVMFRIDGEITPKKEIQINQEELEELLKDLLDEEQWQELESEGEIDTAASLKGFSRIRINVYRQRGSYAAAFRILPSAIPTPEELNIPEEVLELTKRTKGLILITGEAGNGKTTTLASIANYIAQRETKNIIMIENPIEYLISHGKGLVSQREIGSDTKNYAKAVRSAMRQDPDIIFIGELNDMETIEEAVKAAETGHLVISTLSTGQAADTLIRLIEVFPEYRRQQIRVQLSTVLRGVIAQQLVPRCDMEGRSAVFEVMLLDKHMRSLLREGKIAQILSILEKQEVEGNVSMDDAILSCYMKSHISAQTAISYAQNPETMRGKIQLY